MTMDNPIDTAHLIGSSPNEHKCPVTNPDCGASLVNQDRTEATTSEPPPAPSPEALASPKEGAVELITSIGALGTARRAQSEP